MSMTFVVKRWASGAAAIAGSMGQAGNRGKRADPDRLSSGAHRSPRRPPGVGINRGIQLAVQEINAGRRQSDGRQIELITRDRQPKAIRPKAP